MQTYYQNKIEAAELEITKKTQNLRRLEAQRNALNTRGEPRLHRGRVGRRVLMCDQCDYCARSCRCCRSREAMSERWSK